MISEQSVLGENPFVEAARVDGAERMDLSVRIGRAGDGVAMVARKASFPSWYRGVVLSEAVEERESECSPFLFANKKRASPNKRLAGL